MGLPAADEAFLVQMKILTNMFVDWTSIGAKTPFKRICATKTQTSRPEAEARSAKLMRPSPLQIFTPEESWFGFASESGFGSDSDSLARSFAECHEAEELLRAHMSAPSFLICVSAMR